jgi:hypothetical protein
MNGWRVFFGFDWRPAQASSGALLGTDRLASLIFNAIVDSSVASFRGKGIFLCASCNP